MEYLLAQRRHLFGVTSRFGNDLRERPILDGGTGCLEQPRQRHCMRGGNLQPPLQFEEVGTAGADGSKSGGKLPRPRVIGNRQALTLCRTRCSIFRFVCKALHPTVAGAGIPMMATTAAAADCWRPRA